MDQAAYYEQQLMLHHEIEQTILKGLTRPLTDDDAKLLAWATGITLPKQELT